MKKTFERMARVNNRTIMMKSGADVNSIKERFFHDLLHGSFRCLLPCIMCATSDAVIFFSALSTARKEMLLQKKKQKSKLNVSHEAFSSSMFR